MGEERMCSNSRRGDEVRRLNRIRILLDQCRQIGENRLVIDHEDQRPNMRTIIHIRTISTFLIGK